MGDLADVDHRFLEYTMGGGVGDHAARKVVPMQIDLGPEIVQIDIAIVRRLDRHNLPTDHLGRGRVGAMRVHRDQANVAVALTLGAVPAGNGQKARIFALRARVGLHGNRVIARHIAQLGGQVVDHFQIARSLILWAVGMQQRELAPTDRHHFSGRVQLHRAGAKRDHRSVQCQIAVRQTAHIAHHLGFGPVHMKDRVGHEIAGAYQRVGHVIMRGVVFVLPRDPECAPDLFDGGGPGAFVQCDADGCLAHGAQVDALIKGGFDHRRL
mmetsp:Transcript_7428/g.12525  ORF Transcript_7428/g.12525 Transcript_7428/m.12525 type:complete len:268 (-) Transcript_7428:1671-2474(-)